MLNSQWSNLWAIMGVLLIHSVAGVHSSCGCATNMNDRVKLRECLKACRTVRSIESPVYPGNGYMQPLSENIQKIGKRNSNGGSLGNKRKNRSSDSGAVLSLASSEIQANGEGGSHNALEGSPSVAMEHFRWGKPMGKKKRPITAKPTVV